MAGWLIVCLAGADVLVGGTVQGRPLRGSLGPRLSPQVHSHLRTAQRKVCSLYPRLHAWLTVKSGQLWEPSVLGGMRGVQERKLVTPRADRPPHRSPGDAQACGGDLLLFC